jgi:hypothetical protein
VVVFLPDRQLNFCSYVDDFLDMDGFFYMDPDDHGGNLDPHDHQFLADIFFIGSVPSRSITDFFRLNG